MKTMNNQTVAAMNNSYQEIAQRIKAANHIIILPHVNMDGDALGSSSALCMALRALGKKAVILISEPVPSNLDFLAGDLTATAPDFEPSLALMVDCAGLKRIPGREDYFRNAPLKAILDHHGVSDETAEADFGRVEPDAAAAGEMAALLIQALGVPYTLEMAEAIFAAITTDTGNFQHANTTRRTHEIAASLYQVPGFDCKKVSNLIYNRNSLRSIRLQGMMMSSIRMYGDNHIAIGRVTQAMLQEAGCDLSETEGFVQNIMSIDGVEAGCLLKEASPESVRCSLRSRSFVNVANVATSFGGGGHVLAAGCTISDYIDEAERVIAEALSKQLREDRERNR